MLTPLLLLPLLLSPIQETEPAPASQPVQVSAADTSDVGQAQGEEKEAEPVVQKEAGDQEAETKGKVQTDEKEQTTDATKESAADADTPAKGAADEVVPDAKDKPSALPSHRPRPKRLIGGRTIRLKPKATVEQAKPASTLDVPKAADQPAKEPAPQTADQAQAEQPSPDQTDTTPDQAEPTKQPDSGTQDKPKSPFDRRPFDSGPLDPYATLKPGVLPPRTTPAATALWTSIVKAARADTPAGQAPRAPITSFQLEFEITVRDPAGGHNEATTKVRYLAPSFVRFQLEEGTELGFGPDGYWSKDKGKTPVDISRREYAESKRRVQDVRTTAKNFLALAEPGNLRILNLAKSIAPPTNQPPGAAKRLAALDWIVLDSPDFDLSAGTTVAADAAPRLYRAHIGVGKTSHHVEEAMVIEVVDGEVLPGTATWLTMGHRTMLDGISFPGSILIRRAVLDKNPWTFTKRPSDELYLIQGRLVTDLTPDDFRAK